VATISSVSFVVLNHSGTETQRHRLHKGKSVLIYPIRVICVPFPSPTQQFETHHRYP
jgi:hypothetical protein